jgi:GTPase SAR1 family protein
MHQKNELQILRLFDCNMFITTLLSQLSDKFVIGVGLLGGIYACQDMILGIILGIVTCGRAYPKSISLTDINLLEPYRIGGNEGIVSTPIFGKWYFGWYSVPTYRAEINETPHKVWFLWNAPSFDKFEKQVTFATKEYKPPNKVKKYFLGTSGNHNNNYQQMPISNLDNILHTWQKELIDEIKLRPNKHNITVLLTGKTGCGKSTFAEYLANSYLDKSDIEVTEIDPFGNETANQHYRIIVKNMEKDRKVLIFVLDEIDVILQKLLTTSEVQYENIKNTHFTRGGGKIQWNRLMDDLAKNVKCIQIITILTSNKSKEDLLKEVDNDNSLFNEHRIHIYKDIR